MVRAATLVPEADFVIAGNGPCYSKVSSEVERLGLTGRVLLPGSVSDKKLSELMQQVSVFCLPSVDRGEAFGIVLLEAMQYGKPLISTDIPGSGTGWVNQDGITGKVVPPASPEALARAIRSLLKNPEQAELYGLAGKQRFKDEFTIAQVAKSIDRIYKQVAK